MSLRENGLLQYHDAPAWVLHSVYLLLAGVWLAWRFSSPLAGLLWLLSVAALPMLTASLIVNLRVGGDHPELWGQTVVFCQMLGIPIMAGLGWIAGLRCLGPARPHASGINEGSLVSPFGDTGSVMHEARQGRVAEESLRSIMPRSFMSRPIEAPSAALLWQTWRQNGLMYLGAGSLLFVSAVWILAGLTTLSPIKFLPVSLVLMCLPTCWLGVSVFQGDRLHHRVRFLADRGVSPGSVWWTRQAAAFSVLVLSGLLAMGAVRLPNEARYESSVLVILVGMAFLFSLFSISQWVGQVFSGLVIAAIAAPALTIAAWVHAGFATLSLGYPVWLAALGFLLPVPLTRLLMGRWMDGRFDRVYWFGHVGCLALLLFAPGMYVLYTWSQLPRFPEATAEAIAKELEAETASWPMPTNFRIDPLLLGEVREPMELGSDADLPNDTPDALPTSSLNQVDRVLQDLESRLNASTGPISLDSDLLAFLVLEARLARPTSEATASSEEANTRYTRLIRLAVSLIPRVRQGPRLWDQDVADRLEIWLLSELRQPSVRGNLPADVFRDAVNGLCQREARGAARRRAIALSWDQVRAEPQNPYELLALGGHIVPWPIGPNPFSSHQLAWRVRASQMTQALWELLRDDQDPNAPREQLAALMQVPREWYGIGPAGSFYRADDADSFASPYSKYGPDLIGSQWRAGWEEQALELQDELQP